MKFVIMFYLLFAEVQSPLQQHASLKFLLTYNLFIFAQLIIVHII